ncbi:MAG: V-type ATPase subunit [Candidatus Micrarchaeota archaeon]
MSLLRSISSLFSFRPLVYGYANARAHGMFSEFLSGAQMNEMISRRTVQSLTESLQRTPYKQDIVDLSLRFKEEELIELALGKNFARFAKKLLEITPIQDRDVIKAILARWDAHNIKAIILAKKQKKTYEQIAPFLVLAGTLTREKLKPMLEAQTSEEFYSLLRATEFGAGLLSMPSSYTDSSVKEMILSMGKGDAALEPILGALDAYAYHLVADVSFASEKDMKTVSSLLSRIAYRKNLSTVLRLTAAGASPEQIKHYIVPGGKFTARQWVSMAASQNIEQIMQKLSRQLPVATAMEEYKKTKKLSSIEVAVSQENAKKSLKQFRYAQLSLGIIVGALLFKEQEVSNIRKIVRGKALGLHEDEIKKMMVMVKSERAS